MTIESENPPVVELDSEAHAAYIRFTSHPVAKTRLIMTEGCIVTADLDAEGKVIGLELIGVQEFGVAPLLEQAGIPPLRKDLLDRARYISVPRRDMATA